MAFARHILFPALRLLVWAVIAAALVKLAFFGGASTLSAGPPPAQPGAVFTDAVATVTTGTVANTVTVDATVEADPAVEAKATMEGTVGRLAVADGAHVEVGAPLVVIHQEVPVRGGPAPFTCTGLSTGTEVSPGTSDPNVPVEPFAAAPAPSATVQVRCAVPADVQVFPGLAGTMTITAGQAADALLVPVTAVQGLFATGNVWVVGADGAEPVKKGVGLGMTDGKMVQVTEGLTEGDTVLEFIPVGDVPPAGGEMPIGRGF
ncbi:hypothetical protein [Georgenia sp. AZ-5]|uniref:hypothetical protein n=1 Tax=Georgenia sp. AZ-5 TaxID=3367526 RepID=UPI0037548876